MTPAKESDAPKVLSPPADESTDDEFIAQFVGGDEIAIERVRGWARSQIRAHLRLRSPNLEDIEQEVLLDLLEAIEMGRFRGDCRFEAYVRTFSRYKCIDAIRSKKVRKLSAFDGRDFEDDRPSPLKRLADTQDMDLVLRVFKELPERCQELMKMVVDGMSYAEMARCLNVGEGALRVQVHRCRQRAIFLRDRLVSGKAE